jgi:hypothetical protein
VACSRNKREGAGIAVASRVRLGRHLATIGHLANEAATRGVRISGAAHVLVSLCGKRRVSFKDTEIKCVLLGMLSSHRCAHGLCIRHAHAACRRECEVQNGITQPLHNSTVRCMQGKHGQPRSSAAWQSCCRCQGTSGTAPCPCSAWSRGPAQARRSGEHVCAQHGGRPGCGTTTTLQGSTISPRTQDLRGDRWAADIIVRQEEVLGFLDARERLAKGDKLLNVREPVHGPRCTSAKSLRRVQHRPSELFGLKTAGRQFQVSPKPFQNSKRGALPARQRGQGGSRHPEMDLQPDHPTISTLKIYFWSA